MYLNENEMIVAVNAIYAIYRNLCVKKPEKKKIQDFSEV